MRLISLVLFLSSQLFLVAGVRCRAKAALVRSACPAETVEARLRGRGDF